MFEVVDTDGIPTGYRSENPEHAEKLAQLMRRKYPGSRFVVKYDPTPWPDQTNGN